MERSALNGQEYPYCKYRAYTHTNYLITCIPTGTMQLAQPGDNYATGVTLPEVVA